MPTSESNQFDPHDEQREDPEDALDRLLDAAKWPEAPPLVLARLERQWRDVSPAVNSRRQRRRWMTVAAAAVLISAGIYVGWPADDPPVERPVAVQERQDVSPEKQTSKRVVSVSSESPVESVERSGSSEKKPKTPRPRTRRQWLTYRDQVDVAVRDAVDNLAATGQWAEEQVEAAVEPLRGERDYCIRRLAEQVARRDGSARRAAFDLLVELADDRVNITPLLVQLARIPDCHAAAMHALAPRCDSATLARYVQDEHDGAVRQYLLHELLGRNDLPSAGAYLDLVADLKTRLQALQALNDVDVKPTAMLVSLLQRGNPVRRSAAMLALARLDDPQVVPLLSRLVLANVDRQVALMTLMARSDKQSLAFLGQLSTTPAFTGDLISARSRLATIVMINHTAMQEI